MPGIGGAFYFPLLLIREAKKKEVDIVASK